MSGRRLRTSSENRKVESSRKLRTTSEQSMNMQSTSPSVCTSKSFQGKDIQESPSLGRQPDKQGVFEEASRLSSHETVSTEQASGALVYIDAKAHVGKAHELESSHSTMKADVDSVPVAMDHESVDEQQSHSQKSNDLSSHTLLPNCASNSLTNTISGSAKDAPAGDNPSPEHVSVDRCLSLNVRSTRQENEDSSVKPSFQNNKEVNAPMNSHEQKQTPDSVSVYVDADLLTVTKSIFQSLSTKSQRAGQGSVMNVNRGAQSKSSKSHCPAHVHTSGYGSARQARTLVGDASTQAKTYKKLNPVSDMKVAEKPRPNSATQNKLKCIKALTREKTLELKPDTIRKLNNERKSDLAISLLNNGKDQIPVKQGSAVRESKHDGLAGPVDKYKPGLDNRFGNGNLSKAVCLRHTQKNNKRLLNLLKPPASKRIAETDTLSKDTLKSPSHKSLFYKNLMEDHKEEQNGAVDHCHSKMRSNKLLPDKQKKSRLAPVKQQSPGFAVVYDHYEGGRGMVPGKRRASQGHDSVPGNTGTSKFKKVKEYNGLEQTICLNSSPDSCAGSYFASICNISQLTKNIEQEDLVPVISFYWRKREDTPAQEPDTTDSQCILSLDEGLAVLRQIVLGTTHKSMLGKTDYLLSQCSDFKPRPPAQLQSHEIKKESGQISDLCFKLTPRAKVAAIQLPLYDTLNHTHQTMEKAKRLNKNFQQDPNFVDSMNYFRELSGASQKSKTLPQNDNIQQKRTKGINGLESDPVDPDSKLINEPVVLPSTWYSITRRIMSFFRSPRFKDKITSLQTYGTILEDHHSHRDDPMSSDENSQDIDDFVAKQESMTNYQSPSHNFRPPIIAFLNYLLRGGYDVSSPESASVGHFSEIATTSTAVVNPLESQEQCETQLTPKTNTDVNENRSRFQEVLSVLLWKRSGKRPAVPFGQQPDKSFGNNEKSKNYPLASGKENSIPNQELPTSMCDNNSLRKLNEDLKKTMVKTVQETDDKNESQLTHSCTLQLRNISPEVVKGVSVPDAFISLKGSSNDNNVGENYNSHSNARVKVNPYRASSQIICIDPKRSQSCDIFPDPSLDFVLDNTASLFVANMPGLGATNIQQHPHLMWILRTRMLQPEPRAGLHLADKHVEPRGEGKRRCFSESGSSDGRHMHSLDFVYDKVDLEKDPFSVKHKVAASFRSCLSGYRTRKNMFSINPYLGDINRSAHIVNSISKLARNAIRVNEEGHFALDSQEERSPYSPVEDFDCSSPEVNTCLTEDCLSSCSTIMMLSPVKVRSEDLPQNATNRPTPCATRAKIKRPRTSQSQMEKPHVVYKRIKTTRSAHGKLNNYLDKGTTAEARNCPSTFAVTGSAECLDMKLKRSNVHKPQNRPRAQSTHLTKEWSKIAMHKL